MINDGKKRERDEITIEKLKQACYSCTNLNSIPIRLRTFFKTFTRHGGVS